MKFSAVSSLLLSLLTVSLQTSSIMGTSSSSPVNTTNSSISQTLFLLSLLPYPDNKGGQQPSWDEGPTLFLAEQLAIDLLNARPDILPGYQLKLRRADTGCDIITKATLAIVSDALLSKEPILAMVGPGCSASASTVGRLTGRPTTSVLNIHVAGSLNLTSRTLYPNSYSTLDSTEVFVKTLLELVKLGKWRRISALYDDTRLYYSSTAEKLEEMVKSSQTDYDYFISAVYDTYIPLHIVRYNYRVVMLFVGPNFLSKILCLALHYNMLHPVYQFIVVSRTAQEIQPVHFVYDNRQYICTDNDMQRMIHNILIIHYQIIPLNLTEPSSSGLSYAEFFKMYNATITEYNDNLEDYEYKDPIEPSFWAMSFFDATWSLGLVLNSSMNEANLSSYRYGDKKTIEIFKKNLEELSFKGVSGVINFNSDTGYTDRNVDIYRVLSNRQMDIIGYYNTLSNNITLPDTKFINGDFDHKVIVQSVPKSLGAFVLVITVLGLVLVVALQGMTIYFRKYKSIKASSPKLSQFAFVGCYILVLGSIINIVSNAYLDKISPSVNCYLWNVLNVASSLGPTLLYGTVCTRTYRLYRIFVHYKKPGKFISERVLISFVIAFVIVNLVVSVTWTTTDPFVNSTTVHKFILENVTDTSGNAVNLQMVETVTNSCKQKEKYYIMWLVFLVLLNIVLMMAAVVLAYLTRHIHHKNFQTRGIMTLTYILSGLLGLGIPVYFILLQVGSYSALLIRFIISTFLLNSYVFLACFLLFLPPIFPLLRTSASPRAIPQIRVKVKPNFS